MQHTQTNSPNLLESGDEKCKREIVHTTQILSKEEKYRGRGKSKANTTPTSFKIGKLRIIK